MSSESPAVSNFIRQIIEEDKRTGKWQQGTRPRDVPVITRFPPEPNGYLHIGHAKSIHINFGLAKAYGGRCHLRFDDTNPTKESVEYEQAIREAVHWLGFDWGAHGYYASDYYPQFYECALSLIKKGLAFVDTQSAEQIRAARGSLTQAGMESPDRHRSIAENLQLFQRMKAGEFPDGAMVLRAKIDMASPNINLRDPALYRIRHEHHYRTQNQWCIYPMYDYAHCISDALENISHSLCTLEFEDHRPLYEWILNQLTEFFPHPHPQQIEFARLKINHTVTSKRKLLAMVDKGTVMGWDDPRMPTIMGLRRRGFTPSSIAQFCERIGVSKADSAIDMSVLEQCLRDDLNAVAERRIAILNPVKLVLENYPAEQHETVMAPNHPQKPDMGYRPLIFSREIWIEREDFQEVPEKGFHRLSLGGEVRLRYGYIIKAERVEKSAQGEITTIFATYDPYTQSGGTSTKKVKGNIHWLSSQCAVTAKVRLIDHLFPNEWPDRDEDWLNQVNPHSLITQSILVEPSLLKCAPESRFQFERNGYFCADRYDHRPPDGAVFNRCVALKSTH